MDDLPGPAVAMGPERALRTDFSLGVVRAFFVGAANDAVGHNDGFGAVLVDESENRLADLGIVSNIVIFREPAFELVGRGALGGLSSGAGSGDA